MKILDNSSYGVAFKICLKAGEEFMIPEGTVIKMKYSDTFYYGEVKRDYNSSEIGFIPILEGSAVNDEGRLSSFDTCYFMAEYCFLPEQEELDWYESLKLI